MAICSYAGHSASNADALRRYRAGARSPPILHDDLGRQLAATFDRDEPLLEGALGASDVATREESSEPSLLGLRLAQTIGNEDRDRLAAIRDDDTVTAADAGDVSGEPIAQQANPDGAFHGSPSVVTKM